MKKCTFFSLVKVDKKATLKQHDGYTDGVFCYYNIGGRGVTAWWHCIDPKTGYSLAAGATKAQAQERARERQAFFEEYQKTEKYRKMIESFARLIQERESEAAS